MAVGLIEDTLDGKVAMYDTVTGRAFGPVMESKDEADRFLRAMGPDPRTLDNERLEAHLKEIRNIEEADELEERQAELMKAGATAEEAEAQARGDLR